MDTTAFNFASPSGQTLSGRLERPVGPARAWALFAHCFTCSKDSLATRRIARALALRGVGVLRFDFTGLGDSEGEFGGSGFTGDVAELVAAAEAMAAAGMPPTLLVGHSLGGAAALAAAADLPKVRAVATIAAPFDPGHVTGLLGDALPLLERDGEAEVSLGGRPFRLRRSFLEGLARSAPAQAIGHLHKALLILHAPRDLIVGIENAEAIFRAARHPKSFVSLDDADHLLTREADAVYAAGVIAAWAVRYFEPAAVAAVMPPALSAVAEPTGEGIFQTRITVGGESVLVDEPPEVGGAGLGPSPYGLLSAALAACTAMTLRLYAQRKGWAPPRVRVEVTHAKSPGEVPPDLFLRRIAILDEVDEMQRIALMSVADRCPVHKTLHDGARIVTEDVDRPQPMPPPEPPGQHVKDMNKSCDEADADC
jgi:putative redox protein